MQYQLDLHSCCWCLDLFSQLFLSLLSAAGGRYAGYFGAAHTSLPLEHGILPKAARPHKSWEHRIIYYRNANTKVYFQSYLQSLHPHLEATVRIWSRRVQASFTAPLSSMDPDVEAANQPWFISAQLLLVSMERISRIPHLMTSTRSIGW